MLNLPRYLIGCFAIVLCIGVTAIVHQPITATARADDVQLAAGMTDRDSVPTLNRVPDFSMTDQSGTEISSVDLFGHVWIANFMSTRCKDACVVQLDAMRDLQGSLRESSSWEHIRLISIGVDPDGDTSESLTDYIIDNDLDTTQWHFLSGTRNAIRRLSGGGLKLPPDDDTRSIDAPLKGSDQLVLVDWEGRIRGYYNSSSDEEVQILKRDVARVAFERVFLPSEAEEPDWVDVRMRT